MSSRRALARICFAAVLFGSVAGPDSGLAQDNDAGWIDAHVVEIAGTDFYVSVGTEGGLITGAVYELRVADTDASPGRIRVLQAGAVRSAVTFADAPFPITRGAHIALRATGVGGAVRPENEAAARLAGQPNTTVAADRNAPGPEVHGSFGASFEARESTTEWEEFGIEPVERSYTTPSTWLNLTASQLPGGLRFRVNARASHRGSSDDRIQPDGLVRVYAAQVTGAFGVVDFGVGRGYNPHDASSGYFDGVYLHAGRRLGGGVSVGFEPDRANGDVSSEVPKVSVFGDFTHRGASVRYSAVGSVTSVRPSTETGRIDRTYAVLRQTLRVNNVRLGQSLQLDHDDMNSTWGMSRLLLDATATVGGAVSVRGSYSRREPVADVIGSEFQPYSRDLGRIGIGVSSGRVFANVDVGVHNSGLQESAGMNISGSLAHRPPTGFGLNISGSYWDGDQSSTYTLRPGLNRRFGNVNARAWYTFYHSDEPEAVTKTHTVAASLSAPLSKRVRGEVSGRIQRGTIFDGSRIYASVRWAF